MPETEKLVINTGPIISLIAALGSLDVLKTLYKKVHVPFEVCQEILAGGQQGFGVDEFKKANFLWKVDNPLEISTYLLNSLDLGEASVIQMALKENIDVVCIDETIGRRIARLNNLKLTGSIGILIRAQNEGYPMQMINALERMKERGVWLSDTVIQFALKQAGKE